MAKQNEGPRARSYPAYFETLLANVMKADTSAITYSTVRSSDIFGDKASEFLLKLAARKVELMRQMVLATAAVAIPESVEALHQSMGNLLRIKTEMQLIDLMFVFAINSEFQTWGRTTPIIREGGVIVVPVEGARKDAQERQRFELSLVAMFEKMAGGDPSLSGKADGDCGNPDCPVHGKGSLAEQLKAEGIDINSPTDTEKFFKFLFGSIGDSDLS